MTGHFRTLVKFEAKAKDFNFEAKDFKMCPRGQEGLPGLHLLIIVLMPGKMLAAINFHTTSEEHE